MKTILLMTASADGYIALLNDWAPWSGDEYARCAAITKEAGNLIVGSRTYEIMRSAGDFDESILTVVLSKKAQADVGNVHFVASPEEALEFLKSKNMSTAIVGGGATANMTFLHAGLIDEIILDVAPIILGSGLRLFKEQREDVKLELLEKEQFSDNVIRLHYTIKK